MKLLDCTIRDGGYYNLWDFNESTVTNYLRDINSLPIDYIEIGYRSLPEDEYLGEYFYLPKSRIKKISSLTTKNLVFILNEKNTRIEDLEELIGGLQEHIQMVRIAIDPNNLSRSLKLVSEIKNYGYEVAVNVMYLSKWDLSDSIFIDGIRNLDKSGADVFYLVDSYGGIYPDDLSDIISEIKKLTNVPLGFHGHNNLELALINTITAIKEGVEFIDSTIMGMGRGAGNLKTELLLTYLSKSLNLKVNFDSLGKLVEEFQVLMDQYHWGTNLPYMISGISNLPQKQVMEWITDKTYSYTSITNALISHQENQRTFPDFISTDYQFKQSIIVGGGPSAEKNVDYIKKLIEINPDTVIIFASSRFSDLYKEISTPKFFILVGEEGKRTTYSKEFCKDNDHVAIVPRGPRAIKSYIPCIINEINIYELENSIFDKELIDNQTAMALDLSNQISKSIFLIGYDGFSGKDINPKQHRHSILNYHLFDIFQNRTNLVLKSLTQTKYSNIKIESIYSILTNA